MAASRKRVSGLFTTLLLITTTALGFALTRSMRLREPSMYIPSAILWVIGAALCAVGSRLRVDDDWRKGLRQGIVVGLGCLLVVLAGLILLMAKLVEAIHGA